MAFQPAVPLPPRVVRSGASVCQRPALCSAKTPEDEERFGFESTDGPRQPGPLPNPFSPSSRPYFSSSHLLPPAGVTEARRLRLAIDHVRSKQELERPREVVAVQGAGGWRLLAELVQVARGRDRVWLRPLVLVAGGDDGTHWREVRDVRGRDLVLGRAALKRCGETERLRVRLGLAVGEERRQREEEAGGGSGDALMRFLEGLKGMS